MFKDMQCWWSKTKERERNFSLLSPFSSTLTTLIQFPWNDNKLNERASMNGMLELFFQQPSRYLRQKKILETVIGNEKIFSMFRTLISHLEWLSKQSKSQHESELSSWCLMLNQFQFDFRSPWWHRRRVCHLDKLGWRKAERRMIEQEFQRYARYGSDHESQIFATSKSHSSTLYTPWVCQPMKGIDRLWNDLLLRPICSANRDCKCTHVHHAIKSQSECSRSHCDPSWTPHARSRAIHVEYNLCKYSPRNANWSTR